VKIYKYSLFLLIVIILPDEWGEGMMSMGRMSPGL
jgi:hypothetical protein